MESSGYKFQNYIEQAEKCIGIFRQHLQNEEEEIENSKKRVTHLINSFFSKESDGDLDSLEPMRISLPSKSIFSTILKEDTQNGFLFSDERDEKRKRLAAERRAEYNAYLAKKQQELLDKRKVYDEMSATTTPRSVLESVDYETVLAKRKEEESKFRQLNYAESILSESLSNQEVTSHQNMNMSEKFHTSNDDMKSKRLINGDSNVNDKKVNPSNFPDSQSSGSIFSRPLSNHKYRTGGGGEPVKDSFGNLITARGFRDIPPILLLPSFKENDSASKKSSYREELAKQIEEKKRLAALEKEKAQELENWLAQRSEEQRRQMQFEYESELKVNNKVKEQQQQERLRKLEEFKRNDAEMRQKLRGNRSIEIKSNPSSENENASLTQRSSSPPVPAVRSKVIFEKAITPTLPPVQTLSEVTVKPENIFSSLAEIRRKIMQDHQNFNREVKGSYEVMNRRTVPDVLVDDDDNYNMGGISEHVESLKI